MTSISVWQHVKLSVQIRPEIHSHVARTLSNQPTNKQQASRRSLCQLSFFCLPSLFVSIVFLCSFVLCVHCPSASRCSLCTLSFCLPSFFVTASLAKWLRRPPRQRKVTGSNLACDGIFSGSSHTSDLKIGTPVATLPGAWRYRVSTGTGRSGVSIP